MRRCALLLLILLRPGQGWAQETTTNWPAFHVSGLPTVYVLDDAGVETQGKFLRLEPDAVVLMVDGQERHFEAARVKRLTRRGDSLKNGAVIGAVVGVAVGLLVANFADCVDDNGHVGGCGAGGKTAMVLISTGTYAAIGTGLDALIPGRTILYEASPRPHSAVFPSMSSGRSWGAAINVALRW